MKIKIFILTSLILANISFGQRVSGKAMSAPSMEMEESAEKSVLKYGTVEAYDKNNKLVKSVLTDSYGNYNLLFGDTGTYTIKIKYAGFETTSETVKVTDDKDMDFSLERDYAKKTRTLSSSSYKYTSARSGAKALYYKPPVIKKIKKTDEGESKEMGLTASEINDFAKWDLWNDMVTKVLNDQQTKWRLNPTGRYVVQAINDQKKPLVGAKVELINDGNTIWHAVTDNTGKAELWGSIDGKNEKANIIKINHKGKTKTIKSPTSFKQGINHIAFDAPCDISNTAEIAFVVDATGSMSDEINFIKRDLNKVIYNTKGLFDDINLRFGSVFYRDNGDAYLTKHSDFTSVLSEALVYIDEQSAAGGGDKPEAVDDALEVAINKLSWSDDTRAKIIFLILDAPAHHADNNINKIQNQIKKAAKMGIKIVPVTGSGIDKSGEYLTRAMALGTNGKYIFLTNHSGIGHKHIDPTTDEYEVDLLSKLLTQTIEQNLFYPSCNDSTIEDNLPYSDSSVIYQNQDTTSSTEEIKEIKWNFYPNPTRDILNIEVSENIDFIYLTDISGKILEKIPFSDTKKKQINLVQYPTGLYLLRYPIGKRWITGKVILTQ